MKAAVRTSKRVVAIVRAVVENAAAVPLAVPAWAVLAAALELVRRAALVVRTLVGPLLVVQV